MLSLHVSGFITETTAKDQEGVSKWRIIKLFYETDVSTALWTQIICPLIKLTIHMFQNAETILQATANDNELHRLQVKLIEGPTSQSTTGENEETIPQNVADGVKEHSPKIISN